MTYKLVDEYMYCICFSVIFLIILIHGPECNRGYSRFSPCKIIKVHSYVYDICVVRFKILVQIYLSHLYQYTYRRSVGRPRFYLWCLWPNHNEIWHEYALQSLCTSWDSDPTLLTRAPREGQGPSNINIMSVLLSKAWQ